MMVSRKLCKLASIAHEFNHLLRVTAYILRFINNLKLIINRHSVLAPTDLQAEELTQAEQVWIRSVRLIYVYLHVPPLEQSILN